MYFQGLDLSFHRTHQITGRTLDLRIDNSRQRVICGTLLSSVALTCTLNIIYEMKGHFFLYLTILIILRLSLFYEFLDSLFYLMDISQIICMYFIPLNRPQNQL